MALSFPSTSLSACALHGSMHVWTQKVWVQCPKMCELGQWFLWFAVYVNHGYIKTFPLKSNIILSGKVSGHALMVIAIIHWKKNIIVYIHIMESLNFLDKI